MADYSDLKKLAEEVNEAFPNKEGLWSMVCTPTVGLELIAEIDRLRDSHQQVCENYNKVSYASEERGKQIDQLKAENEALRRGMKGDYDLDAWLDWAKEAEALRKDAERLRWLRQYEFDVGSYHGTHEHNAIAWFENISDEDIDSMIADEAQFAKESGHD